MARITKYGLTWPEGTTDVQIQMWFVQNPKNANFVSLEHHFGAMRKAIWPELDDESNGQRWHELCRKEIFRPNAKVTVLMGPGSSGKTHEAAWSYLCDYFCFPNDTLVMVSSTDVRGLELRVWGEMKSLHERAVSRFPFLAGNLVDSKHAITTDDIEEDGVRDLRKGVIGIPTVQGGKSIGLGKWVGVKQKRIRLVADEAQFMGATFLSAFTNLDRNVDFQAVVLGNPLDMLDPLGTAAEPLDGWSSHMEPEKTEVWDTKFLSGRCINLVGTDSPNFDFPNTKFPYLISKEKIERTKSFYKEDTIEYYSQCKGVMKVGQMARRVITRDLCKKFKAQEPAIWDVEPATRIVSLDSAYSGDRCVLTYSEEGKSVDLVDTIEIIEQVIVPVKVNSDQTPEDQIATYCRDYCVARKVPPENFFHDSTGRGTLGTSLARVWSAMCNPVEFGGVPTSRPVSLDLYIFDGETGQNRLKRCDEHYSKFVTELWFSVRYAIESGQLKGLPTDTMEEGCLREWDLVRDNKIEVESKRDMKERVGRSPDLFDSLVIAVEGARRRGFQIQKMAKEGSSSTGSTNSLRRAAKSFAKAQEKRVLKAA